MPSAGPGGRIGFASGAGGLSGHFHGNGRRRGCTRKRGLLAGQGWSPLPQASVWLRSTSGTGGSLGCALWFLCEGAWVAWGFHLFDWRAVYRITLVHVSNLVIVIKRIRDRGQVVPVCQASALGVRHTGVQLAGFRLVSEHTFHDGQRGPTHSLVLPPTVTVARVLVAAGQIPQATEAGDGDLVIHSLPNLLQGGRRGVNWRVP